MATMPIVFTDQANWMQFKNLPNYVRDEIMVMFFV